MRSPNRDRAYDIYSQHGGNIDLVDIAEQLGISAGTVRGWKNKDAWDDKLNGTLQSNTERSKRNKGAPRHNKNAVGNPGGAAPQGNVNAVKHGAYQNIYTQFLPEDERSLLEQMPSDTDLENEIQLLRFKIANISKRGKTFFYDMSGNRHEKELSDEDREKGIIECTKQLEKLIRTQEQNKLQREKLEIEKMRFQGGEWEEDLSGLDADIYGD